MVVSALFVLIAFQAKFHVQIHGPADAELAEEISGHVTAGMKTVENFFGQPYLKTIGADVYPTRAGLDEEFKRRWKAPPTEKWMVAAGIADGLFMLSPKAWKTEATGHDRDDPRHVREIVTHELTHVFHGQHNPRPDFDGMDEMAWFIEGLATYVAGQLDGRRLTAKEAIEAGKAPKSLAEAWTGQYRYGVSGSIVRYVDVTYGRPKLIGLLKLTDTASALKALGTDEKTLLRGWKAYELR